MPQENSDAILVSVAENRAAVPACERSLDELERLLNTAGGRAIAKVIQIKEKFDPRTLIGSGKVAEIAALCEAHGAGLVVFDIELSPMQIRNLEDAMGDARVIDRSMLILDIFALHATSGEGKLQVELAQLKYSAPRLIGKGAELSRQGGGIGTRGPGESQLETDKRHLHERIHTLERRLEEIEHNRSVMREKRDRSGIPKIAVVGYTNAGKSTLLNRLTDAGVLAEDKLFATLDATTRQLSLPGGETVLLTDTVGFIRKLPHHLVDAFKSTLDEVRFCDLLLIVSDITDPDVAEHLRVTEEVVESFGAKDKPRIYAYNKCDRLEGIDSAFVRENTVAISAKEGKGIDLLLAMLEAAVHSMRREYDLLIPYAEQSALAGLYKAATVLSTDYTDDGIAVRAVLDEKARGRYRGYIPGLSGEEEAEE